MSLTTAQILDLAPDASSRKAGQDQAKPQKWAGLGRAGTVIWGEIKGSGASPYRTVADLAGPASKCTCPSRKFPCKHALGLMLVDAISTIAEAEPPDWAAAWMKGRETRAAAAETRAKDPAKPVDERAQAKRRQAREDRVAASLDELDLWLRDLMRRGLGAARSEPYAFWDRMAGRLVDGQAPGLARRVRVLPGLIAAAPRAGAPGRRRRSGSASAGSPCCCAPRVASTPWRPSRRRGCAPRSATPSPPRRWRLARTKPTPGRCWPTRSRRRIGSPPARSGSSAAPAAPWPR
ncbi:hypothetical protein GCM10025880_44790 [Methylorubrum aminovorans]|uniref:SWIM zinc finger family protein n=1 Tax=Methylorubrum aminovorans TaxID=269069 RepID=UPI0023E9B111|nr:SWIM zinc finger family protein [Methylorubrum aminovorans]GMA78062.1 hypothetical protein GCM10025880_44790 [Methylorubrum aminovorans]